MSFKARVLSLTGNENRTWKSAKLEWVCILGFGKRDSVMSMEWIKNGSRKSYLYIINIIIITST